MSANGVIERFFGSIKYEHLYRQEIPSGQALHEQVQAYRSLYNEIRPHEHLDWRRPLEAYREEPTSNLFGAGSVQET